MRWVALANVTEAVLFDVNQISRCGMSLCLSHSFAFLSLSCLQPPTSRSVAGFFLAGRQRGECGGNPVTQLAKQGLLSP